MKKNSDRINIEDVAKEEHFRPVGAGDDVAKEREARERIQEWTRETGGVGGAAGFQEWKQRRTEHKANGDGHNEPSPANGPQDYGSGANGSADQQRTKDDGGARASAGRKPRFAPMW